MGQTAAKPATGYVGYLAVLFAVFFWFADAAFTSLIRPETNFWAEVVSPSGLRMAMRFSVAGAVLLLSFYLQYLLSQSVNVGQSLVESVDLNQRIIEVTPAGIVKVSIEGNITAANPPAQTFLGLNYDEITQRYVSDWETQTLYEDGSVCPVEDYPVSRCLATGEAQSPVTIGVRHAKEDFIMWGIFTAAPLHDPKSGQLKGAVVTFVDITSRKQIEQALKESEDRYKLLVEHSPYGILVHTSRRIVYANKASVALLEGKDSGELIGKQILDFVHPDLRAKIIERNEKAATLGEPQPLIEVVLRTLRGNDLQAEGATVPLTFDEQPSIMVFLQDVSTRKKAEEAKRRSERKIRAILDAMPDLFFTVSRDGTYLDVNAGRPEDLAAPTEQIIGRKVTSLLPEPLASEILEKVQMTLDTQQMQIMEYTLALDHGDQNFEARIVPSDQDEVLAVVRNVTDRKR